MNTLQDASQHVNDMSHTNDAFTDGGSSPPIAHLRTLFEHVETGYLCLAFGPDYEHLTHRFVDLSDTANRWKRAEKYIGMSIADENCFYSGAVYKEPTQRIKANILFVVALLLDRDDKERDVLIPNPTATVTTSPGSWQDIFALGEACDVATADQLQAAMTALCGCNDVHDAGHLARLPGSRNFKHEDAPLVAATEVGNFPILADFAHLPMPEMPVERSVVVSAARIHKDHRNTTLTSTAGLMQKWALSDDAILAGVLAENQARCVPPLEEDEVRKLVRSITTRYPKGEPIGGLGVSIETGRPDVAEPYETFGPAALRKLPPLPFLIDGVIPLHGLGEIVGPPGSGKSFYAVHIAADVASRDDEPKNVLYVAAEGFFGIGQRLAAWESEYRTLPEERFRCIKVAPKLLVAADVDRVISTARQEKSQVIFLDTLARTMGGNENATEDMTKYTDACGRISAVCDDALVLVVHHFGWNGDRQRGNSSLLGAVDVEIQVTRDGGDVTAKVTKAKDFQDGGTHHFTTKTIQLESGASSLVLVPSDGVGAAFRAMSRYQALLDSLETFGKVGATSTEWLKTTDMPKRTFQRAIKYLLGTNEIVKEGSLYKVNQEKGATSAN